MSIIKLKDRKRERERHTERNRGRADQHVPLSPVRMTHLPVKVMDCEREIRMRLF